MNNNIFIKKINLVFLLILFYLIDFNETNLKLFPIVVLLSILFTSHSSKILKIASLFQFLLLPFFMLANGFLNEDNTLFYFNFLKNYNIDPNSFISYTVFLKVFLGLIILYLLKIFFKKITFQLYKVNFLFLISLIIWLWLSSLEATIGVVVLFYIVSFLLRSLYSISIIKLKKPDWSPKNILEVVLVFPFWLKVLPSYSVTYFENQNESGVDQKLVFKKIMTCFLAVIFVLAINYLLNKISFNGSYAQLMSIVYSSSGSILEAWGCIFIAAVRFIVFSLYLKIAIIVLYLNCLGYQMPLPVRSPHLATSFSDFFSRLFVYYGEATSNMFFIPIYRFFNFISNKKTRQGISLFLAVLNMALVFHISRDVYFFHRSARFMDITNYLKEYLIYIILLASLITLSVLFESKTPSRKSLYLKRPIYFILYSLVIIFGNVRFSTLDNKLNMLSFLFGINK